MMITRTNHNDTMPRIRLVAAIIVTAVLQTACSASPMPDMSPMTFEAGAQDASALWMSTCGSCHSLRSPSEYSPEEWPVIVSHMRTRAGLTKSQAEAISDFLRRAADS